MSKDNSDANEGENGGRQSFPSAITAVIKSRDTEQLSQAIWSELQLNQVDKEFDLPSATGSYDSLSHFIETELMIQAEILRSNIDHKMCMVGGPPKEATSMKKAEKHLRITLPNNVSGRTISLPLSYIEKEPSRGQFTNYVYLLQKRSGNGMDNICLAYCSQMQNRNGAIFALGRDAVSKLSTLVGGTVVFARPLQNFSMWKTHLHATVALQEVESLFNNSFVMSQVLSGCIDSKDRKSIEDLERWINSKSSNSAINLEAFNPQQQRALALDDLTPKGLVLIQGPPGTGMLC